AALFFDGLGSRLGTKDLKEKFVARGKSEMERAVATLKPEDRFYGNGRLSMVEILVRQNKIDDAEKLLQQAIDQKGPQEIFLKRRLARLMTSRPAQRDDAITLLAGIGAPTTEQKSGVRGANLKVLEMIASADLADLRLDKAGSITDDKQRAALVA